MDYNGMQSLMLRGWYFAESGNIQTEVFPLSKKNMDMKHTIMGGV